MRWIFNGTEEGCGTLYIRKRGVTVAEGFAGQGREATLGKLAWQKWGDCVGGTLPKILTKCRRWRELDENKVCEQGGTGFLPIGALLSLEKIRVMFRYRRNGKKRTAKPSYGFKKGKCTGKDIQRLRKLVGITQS